MVELLLFGHHECAGLRYGDAHVNLCVMLAAKWWRESAGGGAENAGVRRPRQKARPAMRDGLYMRLYRRIAVAAYLPQKDRK